MRRIVLFVISVGVLGVALILSAAAAQNLPLLSQAPSEDEDPVTVATAWSVDAVHPAGRAVLAVVIDTRPGYHIMADKGQLSDVRDFKPFPTRVWVSEATEGVLSEPPVYPRATPF